MGWFRLLLGRDEIPTQSANTDGTPLVRIDFSDDTAWNALLKAASTPSPDGFLANLRVIEARHFNGANIGQVLKSKLATGHAVLFVADGLTMTHSEHPFLCVNASAMEQTFRVIPAELWGPENNLSLGNMDFHEFVENASSDGIFRGF